MRFPVSSSPSTAASAVIVSVLPLLLLSSCAVTDVSGRQIDDRSITSGDGGPASTTFSTPTVEKLSKVPGAATENPSTEDPSADDSSAIVVSYEVTASPRNVSEPVRKTAAAAAAADDFAQFDVVSNGDNAGTMGEQWVQKITHKRPAVKSAKSLRDREESGPSAFKSPGNPLSLDLVITNVLYGPAWPAVHTSPECYEDMRTYNIYLQNFTLWAAKMFDATSKGPEGLLDGNAYGFGNFDQCVSAKSKKLNISGGYSLVDINFRPTYQLHPGFYEDNHLDDYEPLDGDESAWKAINHNIQEIYIQRHKFQWAVCLPDTCHYKDVQQIVSNVLAPKMSRHGLEANVTIDPYLHTSSKNTYKFTVGFYLVCYMYLLLAGLIVVGTFYDMVFLYYRPKSEHGPMKKILKPFSLIANVQRLLKPSESKEFSIFNGLKVFFIIQVIPGHRWLIEFGNPQSNPDYTHWLIHNEWMGYFKCTIFLETFFVISGFLTFHIITNRLMEKKRLNFILIMIYRWLRIFPVYGTLIVTYIFVLPYLNDGPYWRKLIYRESERCHANWWTNVLFVNNYVHTDELCIVPAWYLACDFHFFIVGTLLTYAIWKWRQLGLMVLGACLTLSTAVPAWIIVNQELRGIPSLAPDNLHDITKDRFFTEVYIKSHMRSLTYFVGILTGYVYMRMKETNYKLSLKSRIVMVPIVIILGNLIYLLSGVFFILGHKYNAYEHALYFTLGRLVWSILIAYSIIGHGLSDFGVCISGFLGHRVFHVVGKLVFCIYMFQELIQLQTIGSMRTPTYQNLILISWKWCGDILMAILYAFSINVMIESPFDRLQKNFMKIFFGNEFTKEKPQITIIETENKTEDSMT